MRLTAETRVMITSVVAVVITCLVAIVAPHVHAQERKLHRTKHVHHLALTCPRQVATLPLSCFRVTR